MCRRARPLQRRRQLQAPARRSIRSPATCRSSRAGIDKAHLGDTWQLPLEEFARLFPGSNLSSGTRIVHDGCEWQVGPIAGDHTGSTIELLCMRSSGTPLLQFGSASQLFARLPAIDDRPAVTQPSAADRAAQNYPYGMPYPLFLRITRSLDQLSGLIRIAQDHPEAVIVREKLSDMMRGLDPSDPRVIDLRERAKAMDVPLMPAFPPNRSSVSVDRQANPARIKDILGFDPFDNDNMPPKPTGDSLDDPEALRLGKVTVPASPRLSRENMERQERLDACDALMDELQMSKAVRHAMELVYPEPLARLRILLDYAGTTARRDALLEQLLTTERNATWQTQT